MKHYKGLSFFCMLQLLLWASGCSLTSGSLIEKGFFSIGKNSHEVKKGDTLYAIAWAYNQDFRKLASINRIKPPYTLYPGQTLKLTESSAMDASDTQKLNESSLFALIKEKDKEYQLIRDRKPVREGIKTPSKSDKKTLNITSKNDRNIKKPTLLKNKNEKKTSNYQNNGVKQLANEAFSINHKDSNWVVPVKGKVIRKFSSVGKLSKGIDFAAKTGSDVISSRSGKVVYAGSRLKGYGNLIIVRHDDVYLSAYAHNRTILVTEGDIIKQGQKIAEVGSSGTNTSKLHFEIRKFGKPIDPLKLLKK